MSKRIKDTDYLFLSTRIRVLEQALLTRERMERMLDASSDAEAARVLVECGYPEMPVVDVDSVNAALVTMRDKVFEDLYAFAPDPKMIDVFKIKYDYHNAKAILKAEAVGGDPARLLVDCGRYDPEFLSGKIRDKSFSGLTELFAQAVKKAREVLSTTNDPQLADFALDRAYFKEMEELAKASGSKFLLGYVKTQVDAANLKCVVRVLRMKKSADYLKGVLFEGGNISVSSLCHMAERGERLSSVYGMGVFATAAEEGQKAIAGSGLTAFERACDNALMGYVAGAKYVPFGDAVLVGYLVAKENELTAVRIIMTGRLAGLNSELIRERLRDAYV